MIMVVEMGSSARRLFERIGSSIVRKGNAAIGFIWAARSVHLHGALVYLDTPTKDSNYPKRWQLIKTQFTQQLKKTGIKINQNKNREHQLWQRRYYEHTIRNQTDYNRHIDYIHYNPIKHGHVKNLTNWPHSSFHKHVKQNKYPQNWAGEGFDKTLQLEL